MIRILISMLNVENRRDTICASSHCRLLIRNAISDESLANTDIVDARKTIVLLTPCWLNLI